MVLFSCVTGKINQLTKCHFKGNVLNCDFAFSLIYGQPAKFAYSWFKEGHVETKNKLLNYHWHLIYLVCHTESTLAYQDKH